MQVEYNEIVNLGDDLGVGEYDVSDNNELGQGGLAYIEPLTCGSAASNSVVTPPAVGIIFGTPSFSC